MATTEPSPATAFVALGANLGDAAQTVLAAIDRIGELPGTLVVARSSLYKTAPYEASGPDFINAVVQIQTSLQPLDLLDALQAIELNNGRERPYRNAPRTLDLDVLLYGTLKLNTPRLTLPHPRMYERAFVLKPLHEIAPSLVTDQQLLAVAGQPIERL